MRHRLAHPAQFAHHWIVTCQSAGCNQRVDRPVNLRRPVKVCGGEAKPEVAMRGGLLGDRLDRDGTGNRLARQLDPLTVDLDPGGVGSQLTGGQMPFPLVTGAPTAEPGADAGAPIVGQLRMGRRAGSVAVHEAPPPPA